MSHASFNNQARKQYYFSLISKITSQQNHCIIKYYPYIYANKTHNSERGGVCAVQIDRNSVYIFNKS